MPSKSTKLKTSGFSSNRKANPIPKAKLPKPPHYLVVDTTLPSHIFSDRSLFTTYVPLRRLHRTVFGTDIIVEGIGDVEVRIVVSGKSILFRLRDSWHVPSSSHHFLSASRTISLGNQIMVAGRSPRLIFSHTKRLVEPNFPKYMPFTRINSLLALEFDIPLPSPQPASPSTHPTVAPAVLSLQASTYYPFAGLAFNGSFLPTSQQVSGSFPGDHAATNPSANVSANRHADVPPDTSQGVVLHGVPLRVLSPQPASPSTHPTVAPAILSLQASTSYPFAGLAAFNGKFLPTSHWQQVSESFPGNHAATRPSASGNVSANKHADVLSDTSQGVVLHGGAHELVDMDGGALADDRLMLLVDGTVPVTGIVKEDAEEQAANLYGGEPWAINQRWLETNSESRALLGIFELVTRFPRSPH